MDRRVRKNKAILKQSFFQLLSVKNMEEITITELCDLADVNRTTFYYHYGHMGEFIEEIYRDQFQDIEERLNLPLAFETRLDNYDSLVLLLKEIRNRDNPLHLLISKCEQHSFMKYNLEHFRSRFEGSQTSSLNKYVQIFGHAGTFQIIYQWISDGCRDSVEELATVIYDLTVKVWT